MSTSAGADDRTEDAADDDLSDDDLTDEVTEPGDSAEVIDVELWRSPAREHTEWRPVDVHPLYTEPSARMKAALGEPSIIPSAQAVQPDDDYTQTQVE